MSYSFLSAYHYFLKLLLLPLLLLTACSSEEYCIEGDDFGGSSFYVSADGPLAVNAGYSNSVGGQQVAWYDTGSLTNGDKFIIDISGLWITWYGDERNDAGRHVTPKSIRCDLGVVNEGSTSIDVDGEYRYIKNHHIEIDNGGVVPDILYLDPSAQEPCWLEGGVGLYIAFFGQNGLDIPTIAYHLRANDNPTCQKKYQHPDGCYIIAENGFKQDMMTYRFEADGFPQGGEDGDFYPANNRVKLLILDRYYADNSGGYNVTFLSGIGVDSVGPYEEFIADIEDLFLGKYNETIDSRSGGILEGFYRSVVTDSIFGDLIRVAILLHIALFSISFLIGASDMTRRDFIVRLLKVTFVV